MLIAAGALALTVLVRAAYVAPLLGVLAVRARQNASMQGRIQDMQERMTTPEGKQETLQRMSHRGRPASQKDLDRFALRMTRFLATIEYFLREPLGWREGLTVVWAGMRGAVTVAAAQSLPEDTPQRSMLVLIAFAVAVMSLLVQGGTIGPLLRRITPEPDPEAAAARSRAERDRIFELMRVSASAVPEPPDPNDFDANRRHRLEVLDAQRTALLDARDNGTFDADVLELALANLDASQIDIEMRGQFLVSRS
ncbi:cation:proton antiporter [Actinoplanes sp. LDG1-06]|uniref:Cation:proton antiporter n=1 Tax=Paractinoplanes ovalisporus TaxID=2810368 RepID=A0ABS2A329_9ACTN|nr:cation:proton antiporter [Actinoplanes ovalisporus]MBM2614247.1 cation:proton antiporter [Actinoplanes ovalisporus]